MSKEKPIEITNQEIMNDIADDIIKIFSADKTHLTKLECKKLLNIIFEALFDEKLKNKNFEYIFNLLSKNTNEVVLKEDLEPIVKALIVCFDVNFITNSNTFNDKVCIKIGKYLLPNSYYIKKEDGDD
jgi:hypothetical protein